MLDTCAEDLTTSERTVENILALPYCQYMLELPTHTRAYSGDNSCASSDRKSDQPFGAPAISFGVFLLSNECQTAEKTTSLGFGYH